MQAHSALATLSPGRAWRPRRARSPRSFLSKSPGGIGVVSALSLSLSLVLAIDPSLFLADNEPMSQRLLLSVLAALALAAAIIAPVAGASQKGYYSPLIVIPSIGVHQIAQRTLATGPVVYYYNQDTGTIGIAGHNVTPVAGYNGHGPFHFLKFIKLGADVYVNHVHYRVVKKIVALPSEARKLLNFHGVVLSACYPDYSAQYRTVVFAAQVR